MRESKKIKSSPTEVVEGHGTQVFAIGDLEPHPLERVFTMEDVFWSLVRRVAEDEITLERAAQEVREYLDGLVPSQREACARRADFLVGRTRSMLEAIPRLWPYA